MLPRDEVHIWQVSVGCSSTAAEWELLSHDERRRALAFRLSSDRIRWIRAHAALRDVLHKYLGQDGPLRFRAGTFGKPELVESCGLRFNLAHSGHWALIAVTRDRDVGIDVEKISLDDIDPVLQTTFSPAERVALARLSSRARIDTFYRGWTRKEAFVKALGLGLHANLPAFDVAIDTPQPGLIEVHAPVPHSSHWLLTDITLDSQHKAALVVEGTSPFQCRLLDWRGPTAVHDFSSETSERETILAELPRG